MRSMQDGFLEVGEILIWFLFVFMKFFLIKFSKIDHKKYPMIELHKKTVINKKLFDVKNSFEFKV